jgi:hypothetical protein
VPPLPIPIQKLRGRITHALQIITADKLHRVWHEFYYCVEVCLHHKVQLLKDYKFPHKKLRQFPLLAVYVVPMYDEK